MNERTSDPIPGPWEVDSYLSFAGYPGWYVRRRISLCSYEWFTSPSGKRKKFKSELTARAAILKATGEQA